MNQEVTEQEIEVTQEMIEAGSVAYWDWDSETEPVTKLVSKVFFSMMALREHTL